MISLSVGVSLSWVTESDSNVHGTVTLTIGIISPSVVTQWVSELLIWDCKFGYTSQYIFNITLTLRCIRLHDDAHWASELGLSRQTKLTRYHLLQLEGSSRASRASRAHHWLHGRSVMCGEMPAGATEMPHSVVWQLRGECLGTPQSRAVACRGFRLTRDP